MRILLVDDEPLARYACRKLIGEKLSGYEVVGEASTGPEALEAFRTLEPDIILMDIELPEISGLEVSLLILRENPDTQIIIVSAYEHFAYAQKAMNTGVLGYVVKPIQLESLRELLENAARNISNSKQATREQNDLHLFRSLAIKDMVTAFMYGRYGGLSSTSFAELLAQPIHQGMFMLCAIPMEARVPLDDQKRRVCEQAVTRFPNCYVGHWIGDVLPVFVSALLGSTDIPTQIHERSESFAKEFIRYIKAKTGLSMVVRVGEWVTEPSLFPHSFQQALDLLQSDTTSSILVRRSSTSNCSSANRQGKSQVEHYPEAKGNRLMEALTHGHYSQAREMVAAIGKWLDTHCDSTTDMRHTINELMILIQHNQMLQAHDGLRETISSLIRILDRLETTDQILHWFPTAMDRIIDNTDRSVSSEETNIQKILHYIDLNDLGSTISLENLADFIGLSPQYISKLFKQKFNINFSDYVSKRRIEMACDLLKTTALSIKEISVRCGYNDVSYFTKVFGKSTGFTPREYRLKLR